MSRNQCVHVNFFVGTMGFVLKKHFLRVMQGMYRALECVQFAGFYLYCFDSCVVKILHFLSGVLYVFKLKQVDFFSSVLSD